VEKESSDPTAAYAAATTPAHVDCGEPERLGDVEVAVACNNTYLTINRLAAADREINEKYQRSASFWRVNTYALQTTFFIAFGRIFDNHRDTFSISKLVEATIANPAIFSKDALRERKRRSSKIVGADPKWLTDFIDQASEPTVDQLRSLEEALKPHVEKFVAIYQPIRHKYFAHRGTESQQVIELLFGKTLKTEVAEIFGFLHTLLWAINEMAWNGKKPYLADFRDYEREVTNLNGKIEEFIRSLP
jgi:hypothetical protein